MVEFLQLPEAQGVEAGECCRLFHGRGHAYPGLEHVNIDWLPPVVLVTLYKEADLSWLYGLVESLRSNLPECRSIQVQYRCRPKAPFELLWGEEITDLVVKEDGLSYNVQFGKTQNIGFFLDMRNGRRWVQEHGEGKRILNLFAFTCSLSVAAITGGAERVANFDVNRGVLSRGRDNHRLNNQDTRKVVFEGVDIFKSFSRLRKYGPYELLICDPPEFQKGSVDIRRDYKKIIRRIPELVVPGGDVMLCLNSPDLDETFLLNEVSDYAPCCEYVEAIKPPAVFKEQQAGRGLKVLIFKYSP